MPDSPVRNSDDVLRLTVKSNGSPVADSVGVISVQVQRAVNNIPSARLVIADGDMPSGEWSVADASTFQPGAAISIAASYGDGDEQPLFEGIVVKLGMKIDANCGPRLVIDCRHAAVAMTVARRNAHHAFLSDSDIIRGLVGSHGMKATVDATSQTHGVLTQYYCTDWDFLVARAEANGLLVIADDDGVAVQAPRISGDAALRVGWGTELMEFKAEVDAHSQLAEVRTVAWNPAKQSAIEGTPAKPQVLNAQGNLSSASLAAALASATTRLQTSVPLAADELCTWGKAQQLKAGLARIRGRMKFQGCAAARVGSLVEVEGVGARFNGKVFVSAVDHALADGDWFTEVEFGMPPHWHCERADVVAPAAAGRLPAVEGLQIGVVTQLDGDPAGEQRIQIKLPVLQAEHETTWARLLQLHASAGSGAFFVPEVGDEVVVGFFNHDPSHPVVLGSLYSSARQPAYALEARNDTKALVTRCGHRLEFDDRNGTITLTTAARNKLVLSDSDKSVLLQDQNGNRVELDAGGVTIDTPKDLKLTAKGSISIKAEGAVDIGAKADLSCIGLNLKCEADVAFGARGGASAELSAAGQTTVKGAMVMIN